jgi:hypothetical protein
LGAPPLRRDLIDRRRYLCPNSLVVSRGCPHHCEFCYKDAFYQGGRSFSTRAVDEVVAEIERLPGRHLYFLDDHLLGHRRFAAALFAGRAASATPTGITTTPATSSTGRAVYGRTSSWPVTVAPTVTLTAGRRSLEGPQVSRRPGRRPGTSPMPAGEAVGAAVGSSHPRPPGQHDAATVGGDPGRLRRHRPVEPPGVSGDRCWAPTRADLGFVQRPPRQGPPLATLQGGQAMYAPPDGQRTADLNPAGAEVPT